MTISIIALISLVLHIIFNDSYYYKTMIIWRNVFVFWKILMKNNCLVQHRLNLLHAKYNFFRILRFLKYDLHKILIRFRDSPLVRF